MFGILIFYQYFFLIGTQFLAWAMLLSENVINEINRFNSKNTWWYFKGKSAGVLLFKAVMQLCFYCMEMQHFIFITVQVPVVIFDFKTEDTAQWGIWRNFYPVWSEIFLIWIYLLWEILLLRTNKLTGCENRAKWKHLNLKLHCAVCTGRAESSNMGCVLTFGLWI